MHTSHTGQSHKRRRKMKKERDKSKMADHSLYRLGPCPRSWLCVLLTLCKVLSVSGYTNHPPRFVMEDQTEIVLRLKEGGDTPAGSLIYRLRGIDPDGDPLTFGVREHLGNEILQIEKVSANEANVYLKKELDRETRDEYGLVLTLTDGRLGEGNFITQSLLILVEDVNDNEPVFKPYQTTIVVPENSPAGILTTVEATDQDEGTYGQVVYHLQELDGDDHVFSVSTVNGKGVIRLVGSLDYEKKFLYQLRVLAVDRSNNERINTGTAAILVKVQDVEDQLPEFLVVSPVTRISEDAQIGSAVLRVKAVDGDRGINNRIIYSISKGAQGVFDIDPSQGIVYTTQALDRESPHNNNGAYILEITAEEDSKVVSPPPSVKTEVTIIVTDVNDEIPTFRSDVYVGEVNENAQENTPITFLGNARPEVFDYDQGNNGTFQMIIDGDRGVFEVTPSTGINEASFLIRVKDSSQLDYEKLSFLNFTLIAKETVPNDPKYSLVSVTVYVRDMNDNVPEFDHAVYAVLVAENARAGTVVAKVHASDLDSGSFGSEGVRYTSLGGSVADHLALDPVSGLITIKTDGAVFDRELVSRHYLTVEARDDMGKGNRNTVQLIVDVEDVNDNAPVFLQSRYEARLLENALHFESPLILEAHDNDLNGTKNSEVHYSIVEGDRHHNFTIDPVMGLLQPKTHVDFEELARQQGKGKLMSVRPLMLLVRAQDMGTPSLSSDVLVTIHVLDMNDHAPIFEQNRYERSVPENLAPGSSVIQVQAHDDDSSSPNNDILYRIQKGAKDKFVINSETGVISVAPGASLDPDLTEARTTQYALTVLAVDGGIGVDQLQSTAEVNITITDVNNKVPVFRDPGIIRVKENINVGQVVYRVVAMDLDEEPILRYRIDVNSSEARNEDGTLLKPTETDFLDIFELNSVDGLLQVRKQLDREKVEVLKLVLTCEDLAASGGEQVASAVLTVIVEDENDNNPVFRKPFYKRSITENSKNGVAIVNIVADDPDKNRTVTYSMEGPKATLGLVYLDPDTGEMVVANKIDHEITPWLNYSVRATDSGVPPRSALVEVYVQVLDENDNNPFFVGEVGNLTVREDAAIGTEIGRFEAKDADSGDYGRITYLLDRMSSQGKFHVNPDTGVLTVADALDRETQGSYLLVVEAWDNYQFGYVGGESRNAFRQIGITVVDVNDNPPVLEPMEGCASITEFHDTRDVVAVIKARDADDANTPNGRIGFTISRGNENRLFKIENVDYTSARILATVPLKGFYGNYTLRIQAQDMGSPPNSAEGDLSICVNDFNDNPPRFISPPQNVTIRVPENTTVGNAIIQIVAVDDDTGVNGAVRYRLKRDPVGSWRTFEINEESGVITLKQPLDRERQKLYELRVEAHDLGIPTTLSSDLDLTVYVKNVNDFEPQFLVKEICVNFTEHEAPGLERRILVETIDKDEVDDLSDPPSQVCYFIVGGNDQGLFTLEPLRHELTVEQELDREETEQHVLLVKATEDCLHSPANISSTAAALDSTVLRVVIKVNDINDHPPKFIKRVFTGGVATGADFGTEFMAVKAVDQDEGRNAKIKYYQIGRTQMTLTEGMDTITGQPFLVDEETGAFYLNFYPQKGMKGYFDLMVLANDTDGLQDMARVYIYLLREDQRVRFVLRQHPVEVRDKVDRFRDELKDVTGAIVNVDEVKVHDNSDGTVDKTKTDLYLHFVNHKDNSVIDVNQVLQIVDENIERLDGLFKDFNVLDTQPAEALQLSGARENAEMISLLGVIIFLGIMLVLVLSLCLSQRTKYKREIKAATAAAFGSEQTDINRVSGRVPNTNLHSVEGSNPMWMKAYENEWYKDEDSLSQTSERDSLDNNAVANEQQKTNSEKTGDSEHHSDNSNSTCNSTTNIISLGDKTNSVKEQNDLNRSNYQQNLYHSMKTISNPLLCKKKLETTEL